MTRWLQVGELCSPLVHIELEPGTTLISQYEISLPHSFAPHTPLGDDLAKRDIVVAHSQIGGATWQRLDEGDYDLVPAGKV